MPDIESANRLSKDLRTLLWIHYAAQHQDQLKPMAHKEVTSEERQMVDQTMRASARAYRQSAPAEEDDVDKPWNQGLEKWIAQIAALLDKMPFFG